MAGEWALAGLTTPGRRRGSFSPAVGRAVERPPGQLRLARTCSHLDILAAGSKWERVEGRVCSAGAQPLG